MDSNSWRFCGLPALANDVPDEIIVSSTLPGPFFFEALRGTLGNRKEQREGGMVTRQCRTTVPFATESSGEKITPVSHPGWRRGG